MASKVDAARIAAAAGDTRRGRRRRRGGRGARRRRGRHVLRARRPPGCPPGCCGSRTRPPPRGRLRLDAGAVRAVVERRLSLLAAGVTGVEGDFVAGDPVDLLDENGHAVARGLVNFDVTELPGSAGSLDPRPRPGARAGLSVARSSTATTSCCWAGERTGEHGGWARHVAEQAVAPRRIPPPDARPMWHVTLTVVGEAVEAAEVRSALERLTHERPFLLSARYAADRAELRYWEEARDLEDAAALALRLWGEHRSHRRPAAVAGRRPRGGRPGHLPAPRDGQPGAGAGARRRRPAVLTARPPRPSHRVGTGRGRLRRRVTRRHHLRGVPPS